MANARPTPAGLPVWAVRRLRTFAKTRSRLYHLMVAWSLCTVAIGSLVPVDAIEPVTIEPASWPCGLQWLGWLFKLILFVPSLTAFVIPGLPGHLVDVVTRRPVVAVILLGAYILIRSASSLVKAAEAEYAFQVCQGISILEPNAFVRLVGKIVPPVWLTWVVVIGFVLLISLALWPRVSADRLCMASTLTETAVGGLNTCHLRRLAPGEKVQIMIRSDRERNATGVWLEKDLAYTARYIGSHDWHDAGIKAPPQGFEFGLNCLGWQRFRWMKWMRPYPEGCWFQVIGRIDYDRNVFPILDGNNPGKRNRFSRPSVSGELVLLVNDVIYWNNHGVMTIEICRCRADESADKPEMFSPCPIP